MEYLAENVERDGFAIIDNLFTPSECDEMIEEIRRLTSNINNQSRRVMFRASSDESPQQFEKYFMESAHKISFFYEEKSVDPDGNLNVESEFLALNKIGHALHSLSPVFRKYTFDNRIKEVCSKLKLNDPVVCQSMFVFKNPKIGGEVPPHQDATYLHTDPQNLYGLWIALEDVTVENACLWFEKGSHKRRLYQRMIINPDKTSQEYTIYTGDKPECELKNFISAPAKKGSCVVIHGKVLHFSKPNISNVSRNVYTFHVFDKHDTVYSKENWIQPEKNSPFLSIYKN